MESKQTFGNVIFYFSGTGNSLQVAKDIADGIGGAKLANIGGFNIDTEITSKCIGIVFPVYCWGPPLIVSEFADKMKAAPDAYVFAVATYGGFPGGALKTLKGHLDKNSVTMNAAYKIHMPGNCIISYGAQSEKTQQKCFANEKATVGEIAGEIKNRAVNLKAAQVNPVTAAISEKIYRKEMSGCRGSDRYYSVGGSCTGCGMCADVCPVNNITIEAQKPVWHHKCESCMACIQRCPKESINYKDKTQSRKRYANPNISCKDFISYNHGN